MFRVLPGVTQMHSLRLTPPPRLMGICSHVFASTQPTVDHAGTAMQRYVRGTSTLLTLLSRAPFPRGCSGSSHPETRDAWWSRVGRTSWEKATAPDNLWVCCLFPLFLSLPIYFHTVQFEPSEIMAHGSTCTYTARLTDPFSDCHQQTQMSSQMSSWQHAWQSQPAEDGWLMVIQ